jgi:uncharacterized membrane protein
MNRAQFISRLREGLSGLPQDEADEIVDDYEAHFAEGLAAGRSEESVAAALGHPSRLTREMRAEAGLRRFEEKPSPGNFAAALLALIGLVAVDLIFLLPILFTVILVLFTWAVVVIALVVAGIAVVASLFGWADYDSFAGWVAAGLAGVGLAAGGVGFGALLLLVLDVGIRLLGRYARLHYQLLKTSNIAS